MARSQKSSRQHAPTDAGLDGLYDYARASSRHGRRREKRDQLTWKVTDDWPNDVPVAQSEIDVFEAWFGDLFENLFNDG